MWSCCIILYSRIDVGDGFWHLQKGDIICLFEGKKKVLPHSWTGVRTCGDCCNDQYVFNWPVICRASLDLSEYKNYQYLTVRDGAFKDASSLTLPNSITELTFGKNTFKNLKITSLTLPTNLRSLTFNESSVSGDNNVMLQNHQQIKKIVFNENSFKDGELTLISIRPYSIHL